MHRRRTGDCDDIGECWLAAVLVAQVPEINKILGREEKVLWEGKPVKFVRIKPYDWFTIPIGIYIMFTALIALYLLFALYTGTDILGAYIGADILGAGNLGKPLPQVNNWRFILLGLPTVPLAIALGIHFGFGRLLRDRRTLLKSEYAITNQRIIILIKRKVFMNICRSVPFNQLRNILHSENKKGVGTIQFVPKAPELSLREPAVAFFKSKDPIHEFAMIDEVQKVKALLEGLLQSDAAGQKAG